MKKLAVCAVGLLVLLTGCGGNSAQVQKTEPASKTEAQKSEPAKGDTSNAMDTLDKIKKDGKILIGTTGDYRPFTYMDSKNQLAGYDIEWGNLIAKELGVKAEFVTGKFAGLIPALESKRFDILLSGINATEDRKKALNMSVAYATDGPVAIIKKGSNAVTDVTNIKDKNVGVNAGSVFEDTVKEIGGYKQLKGYPGPNESFADLMNGRIDAVVLGKISATDYLKNSPNGKSFEIVGNTYKPRELGIAMRKGDDKLKAAIDKIIEDKKKDGTLNKIAEAQLGVTFDK